ncbi:putative methyltransferase DDB_G0268948 [Ricinus communis]|uniref:S-adenosylmethionine-dependent methyltransferase, putative n=1 Tax=Ricinus communis TaxID=3988 RepID=B9SA12_RICCO|nr:putative methyltransferase DDB_G0268948 [Ricinus communis]EEF39529.1 S-adenosylmethionine-dependent methyltransferase, putative [Ricinus communis]|eukprot:XP_002522831.1 putative methyltransferase DDB_G0268948 [Ricinus communis]
MAGLFDKQAAIYLDARPTFPKEWFSMLSALTLHHSLAWDAGTGNGQAAICVAEHYDQVIATDISEEQIKHAIPNPRVRYFHTPSSMSDDEIVSLVGAEHSVDLVTVSVAVHYFDLERFYSQVKRLLRKPGGIIAVWTYNTISVNSEFDPVMRRFYESTLPFQNPKAKFAFECYKTLPFPFESVGVGCEGQPTTLDMPKEMSFEGMLGLLRSWSAVNTAKDQGVDLLSENVVKEFEDAWGGSNTVRTAIFKTYMIAGKVKQ